MLTDSAIIKPFLLIHFIIHYFYFEPLFIYIGDLKPGQTVTIFVTFSPQDSGTFKNQMDVYISDQNDKTRPYLSFCCRGIGSYPRLLFSKHQLDLPTVPLGKN